jgi:hypothetical protein
MTRLAFSFLAVLLTAVTDPGRCPHHGHGVAHPEATGPRLDLRRRQITRTHPSLMSTPSPVLVDAEALKAFSPSKP